MSLSGLMERSGVEFGAQEFKEDLMQDISSRRTSLRYDSIKRGEERGLDWGPALSRREKRWTKV